MVKPDGECGPDFTGSAVSNLALGRSLSLPMRSLLDTRDLLPPLTLSDDVGVDFSPLAPSFCELARVADFFCFGLGRGFGGGGSGLLVTLISSLESSFDSVCFSFE